ncbi:MAG TPA: TlyA family rRNA (cytidine-2'-O)-methyltransferase [Candidatus Binatia bacterium]|nr:TlyA family rRNA (cytidine-2'-O)-methyltransferase [Candidatus Binatia bacterium]
MPKTRLDLLLVARGLVRSREEAQRMILAGEVRVGERRADKASESVAADAALAVGKRARFVSRGGEKLEGALSAFGIDVSGSVALDVGASTGGFTDCLLQHGARRVYAVDVGRGQLDWRLRQDPRVVVIERQNVRTLPPSSVPEPVEVAVVDVSFISLRLVLPRIRELAAPAAIVVALVKPQFEVGRGKVGKGGVVRDVALHREAIDGIRQVARVLGFVERGFVESPLRGPSGNREFFLYWSTDQVDSRRLRVNACRAMGDRRDRLAQMLNAKRAELLLTLRREFGERLEEDALGSQDEKIEIGDRSVSALGQDVELERLAMKRRELRRIDEALERLDLGGYGLCEDCDAEIAEERLEVVPFATRCVDCERRREVEDKRIEATGRGFRAGFRDIRERPEESED